MHFFHAYVKKKLYLCSEFGIVCIFMSEKKGKHMKEKEVDKTGWQVYLGKYLIDISKYVVTGVIIASIFKDMDDKILIYILSAVVALIGLIIGLILVNVKKGV